jgi:hypothetical protein
VTISTQGEIEYEVVLAKDAVAEDKYNVEAVDYENEGIIYFASFSGPRARERAEEYAQFKNGQ